MIGIEQFSALTHANIQAMQRFYTLAWETARELFVLQTKSYESLLTGNGNIGEAWVSWQKLAEESVRKTVQFTDQHVASFAQLQANVAEDVELTATEAGTPLQYTQDAEAGGGKRGSRPRQ